MLLGGCWLVVGWVSLWSLILLRLVVVVVPLVLVPLGVGCMGICYFYGFGVVTLLNYMPN